MVTELTDSFSPASTNKRCCDAVIITDLALLEISTSLSAALSDLHVGDGSALVVLSGGLTTIDYTRCSCSGATDNIIDFGSVATGTAGIAVALAGGTMPTVKESTTNLDNTDAMFCCSQHRRRQPKSDMLLLTVMVSTVPVKHSQLWHKVPTLSLLLRLLHSLTSLLNSNPNS